MEQVDPGSAVVDEIRSRCRGYAISWPGYSSAVYASATCQFRDTPFEENPGQFELCQ